MADALIMVLLAVLAGAGIPAGVWFGMRVGRMQADAWWLRQVDEQTRRRALLFLPERDLP